MNSELRYHQTLGEWVLIAPRRQDGKKKPNEFKKYLSIERKPSPLKTCPFEDENLKRSGNFPPYFWFPETKPLEKWSLQVLPNKFPALEKISDCRIEKRGIYFVARGVGSHDLVITRNHFHSFGDLKNQEAEEVFLAFQKRFRQLALNKKIAYISIFCNWGPQAGASIFHPHYQIIGLPVIPHSVSRSLLISKDYFRKNKRCIHCDVLKEEMKEKKRIVYENKNYLAFVPFASKEPFWVCVFPKKHQPFFEDLSQKDLKEAALVVKKILALIKRKLNDPDYNFFIHTAPLIEKKKHTHYHWHLEIVPKSNISAGFELGTGIEINPVFPEEAARFLKRK